MKRWALSLLWTGALLFFSGCQSSPHPHASPSEVGTANDRSRDINVLPQQMSNSSRRPFVAISASTPPAEASSPYLGRSTARSVPPAPPATAERPPPVGEVQVAHPSPQVQPVPVSPAPLVQPVLPVDPDPALVDTAGLEAPPPPDLLPAMQRAFVANIPERLEMPVPVLSRWVDWEAIPGGWVRFEISLDQTGRVTRAEVIESSHPDLEEPALEAIRQARYSPLLDPFGQAVLVTFEDEVAF